MKKKPKISIVIPTYSQGQYIEECILSVLNQKYSSLELIIIDGGSADNTVNIIKKYEDYITYWVSEPDQGQSNAINKGLKKCTGDVFNWLNSDDFLEKEALSKVSECFLNSDIHLLCGISRRVYSDKNIVDLVQTRLCKTIEETIFFGSFRQGPSFFKTEVVRALGGVNNDLHYVMDSDLYLRYLLTYGLNKIQLLNDVLINFRLHPTSKTFSEKKEFSKEFAPVVECMLRKQKPYSSSLVDYQKLLAYYYARKALNTSRYNITKYLSYLLRSVRSYPRLSLAHTAFLLKKVISYRPRHNEVF